IIGLIFALCGIAACNYFDQESQKTMIVNSITEPKTCYAFNNGRDSIHMSIEINNNDAKGDLDFNYFEKDSNTGTFSGSIVGDTLWAVYSFHSEGTESKREIMYLKTEYEWVQGYGEITEENGGFVVAN